MNSKTFMQQQIINTSFDIVGIMMKPYSNCVIYHERLDYDLAAKIKNSVRRFFKNLENDWGLDGIISRDHKTALTVVDSTLMILPMSENYVRGRTLTHAVILDTGLSGPCKLNNFKRVLWPSLMHSNGAVRLLTL